MRPRDRPAERARRLPLVDALGDAVVEAAAGTVRGEQDAALRSIARAVVDAGSVTACTIATWDDDVAGGLAPQRSWTWPPVERGSAGPPVLGDVLVVRDGVVLGYLRLAGTPPRGDRRSVRSWAQPAADLAALLLGQRSAALRVARRQRAAAAEAAALADARRAAAVGMDEARRALERDLHDGVQGELVGLVTQVALLEHIVTGGTGITDRVRSIVHRAREVDASIAATAAGIVPASLSADGLDRTLRRYLPPLLPGLLRVDVVGRAAGRRWSPEVETAVFYVCLEAVSNAGKHAPGARVDVTLDAAPDGVEVQVHDSGPGFDGPAPPGAFAAMRDRARSVSGWLDVRSSRRHGTVVTLLAPG